MEASDASVKLARRLTALDSTFLYGESANNPLHIGSLLIFEGNIPFDDLVQHVDRRLHLLPRYRQRVCGELLISPESAIGHTQPVLPAPPAISTLLLEAPQGANSRCKVARVDGPNSER